MKRSLSTRFTLAYALIGVIGFLLVTLMGSCFAEKFFERDLSEALYEEAMAVCTFDSVKRDVTLNNIGTLKKNLSVLAKFQNTEIWVINHKGEIILSTSKNIDIHHPVPIKNFDAAAWVSNYYQKGTFYGYFKKPRLSVLASITDDLTVKGYIAIHYRLDTLYKTRDSLVLIMHIIFLMLYGMVYLLVFEYRRHIARPLHEITKGASAYAAGELSYKIPIEYDDELGYLANTLNYMSDELSKSGEYTRNFISNISHDFRSPLTSIKGYVNAILDGTIPVEMQDKYLRIIASESDRLEKLTQGLLTLKQLDIKERMLNMESFDINGTIKDTALFFEGVCTERKIRLELILLGKELYVTADMEQIQQVLYNLLDNAIKFSRNDSTITMETTQKNNVVFVSVRDRGEGIPFENLPKIWHRFYKQDASRGKDRKGTGLGLPIVREIINAHHQHIDVVSTPGVGTKFTFTLEKTKEEAL